MDFGEALKWLYGFQKFGIKLGLERINCIVEELGHPQKNYKIVHVGGTNGKGSVCRVIGSILEKAGYKVGIYVSPHLQRFSERIIINNKEISEDEIVLLVEKIKPIIDDMLSKDNVPTFFEIVTAMAFQYFSDKEIDFAIVEVGLGGRFDATNVVEPMVSVITNVSMEHEEILGKEISDIAFEKAGIIKKNVPVVTSAKDEAYKIIENVAEEKNSQLCSINDENWTRIINDDISQEFFISGFLEDYSIQTSMMGKFQGENIALAISAIEFLQCNGIYISDANIYDGVKVAVNPGRMEILKFKPIVLLDGAHNSAGMLKLRESLKNDFNYDKLIVVIGILSDKNISSLISIILPIADNVIVTKPQSDRAFNPVELKEMIEEEVYRNMAYTNKVVIKEKISEAIDYAELIAEKNSLICITGSLYTVGEAREFIINK